MAQGPKPIWQDTIAAIFAVLWAFFLLLMGILADSLSRFIMIGMPMETTGLYKDMIALACLSAIAATGIFFTKRWGLWLGGILFFVTGIPALLGSALFLLTPIVLCLYCFWRLNDIKTKSHDSAPRTSS